MTPAIRAVMFDFGGVLTSSPLTGFAAYERRAGLPAGLIARLNMTNQHENAWARYERGEVDEVGFVAQYEAEALDAGYRVDAREVLLSLQVEQRPEMLAAIGRLRAAGLSLAMLTNNIAPLDPGGPLRDVLELFDVVLQSSVERIRKPDPEFYRRALDRLGGIAPQESVFLDDIGANLKTARAMGIVTIRVVDPAEALRELEEAVGMTLRG